MLQAEARHGWVKVKVGTNVEEMMMLETIMTMVIMIMKTAGLHKLWYPGIRDMSTWSKFGAHGEHGDVFLFSNLGAL